MRITESKLRNVIRSIVREQAETPSTGGLPVQDPKAIGSGPTYGHTDIGTEYAPAGMSEQEAVAHLNKRFAGAPLWKFIIARDPKDNRVYAYYEIDTSG